MSEATLIFQHMRGGCATVGNTVHALFRVNGRRPALSEQNMTRPGGVASSAADASYTPTQERNGT